MSKTDWRQRAHDTALNVHNLIDGKRSECGGSDTITKHFAGDGRLLYSYGSGEASEVDRAVASARAAFEDGRWRNKSVYERRAILEKLADLLEQNKETLALYECLDVGKTISKALTDDIGRAVGPLRGCAEKATQMTSPSGGEGGTFVYRKRKPLGVVGGILGWNYPLALAAGKVGHALATGNSLVLKPSEFTPLSTIYLAELALEAGVPPGVFNVVCGNGDPVGARLSAHPDVDLMSFVGSSATGKQMMIAAGQSNMKRLILECGGKSPYIVFDDCVEDLDWLAWDIVADTAFVNQGQICVSSSRVLIQESLKDKLLPKLVEQAKKLVPADPLDPESNFGPLMNEAHLHKVLGFIEAGKESGAELVLGGNRANPESGGCYVEPTIFANVDPDAKIAQEEIFGPVMSVITFKDEEEAVKLANNSCYGLAAYVSTTSLGRAQRMADQLQAGSLIIVGTTTPSGSGAEVGYEGHKQSGFGMEGSINGLESYTTATGVYLMS